MESCARIAPSAAKFARLGRACRPALGSRTNRIPGPVEVIVELAEKMPAARRIPREPFQKDAAA
jgi:hypothetical protein